MVFVGLLCVCVGGQFTRVVLRVFTGDKYTGDSSAAGVLSWYCLYLLLMAVNGTCEAFVHSVISVTAQQQQQQQQCEQKGRISELLLWMCLSFAVFALSVWPLYQLMGSVTALVAANCLSMSVRIWYARAFIQQYFRNSNSSSNSHSHRGSSTAYTAVSVVVDVFLCVCDCDSVSVGCVAEWECDGCVSDSICRLRFIRAVQDQQQQHQQQQRQSRCGSVGLSAVAACDCGGCVCVGGVWECVCVGETVFDCSEAALLPLIRSWLLHSCSRVCVCVCVCVVNN